MKDKMKVKLDCSESNKTFKEKI